SRYCDPNYIARVKEQKYQINENTGLIELNTDCHVPRTLYIKPFALDEITRGKWGVSKMETEKRYIDPQAPVGYIIGGEFLRKRILAGLTPVIFIESDGECWQYEKAIEIIKMNHFKNTFFVVAAFETVHFIQLNTKSRVIISTGLRPQTFELHDGEEGQYISFNNGEKIFS